MAAALPNSFSPSDLAQLALTGALALQDARGLVAVPRGRVIRRFWSASRNLQHDWLRQVAEFGEDISGEIMKFERLALEVLLTDLLSRVWATHWTIVDRRRGSHDVEKILHNALHGLERVRQEVLLLMIRNWHGPAAFAISRLDRFRRRSERWTDLLLAGPASKYGVWEFAVERDRAQDFAQNRSLSVADGVNPASLLVSAGLRVMFAPSWPPGCCEGPRFAELVAAIRAMMPAERAASPGAS